MIDIYMLYESQCNVLLLLHYYLVLGGKVMYLWCTSPYIYIFLLSSYPTNILMSLVKLNESFSEALVTFEASSVTWTQAPTQCIETVRFTCFGASYHLPISTKFSVTLAWQVRVQS